MEKIKPGMLYIAADGDGIGKLVGRAVIANDVVELHKVSNRIDAAQDFILHWCKDIGGIKISGGGDEFTAAIPSEAKGSLKDLRASIEKSFGYTISVGVGRNLSEAGTALLVAKLRGKDRIVWFNKKIKEDIKKAKRRVREGRASQEEYKLSEAYLEKSELMLCKLHKSEKKNPGDYGNVEPHTGHRGMMGAGFKFHMDQAKIHRDHSETAHSSGNRDLGDKHHKMSEMHRIYTHAIPHEQDAPGRDYSSGEKAARKLRLKLTKSEHLCDIHKHEEGAHNSLEAKEGKLMEDPNNEDNRTDDCNLCADLDAVENADGTAGMHEGCQACADYDAANGTTGGMDDCPACKEYDAERQTTGGIETDDCPYCQEDSLNNSNPDGCEMCNEYNAAQGTKDLENISGAQDHPEQDADHICSCPDCPKNAGAAGDAQADVEHPDNCPECQEMYGDAVEEQPGQTGQEDPNLQGHETAEQVLGMLDQEPGAPGQTPAQAAKKIDNTEMPQGDQMKDGTAVTEDFGPAQKADVSDADKQSQQDAACNCPACPKGGDHSEPQQDVPTQNGGQDEPDMTGVLQGGLDDHADAQKKQQVLNMVGQTLAGFKANKASLEATKEQNAPLYQSCIQMLKAMISLCDLLGLKAQAAPAAETPPQTPPEAAPGAAAQEGSPNPKAPG